MQTILIITDLDGVSEPCKQGWRPVTEPLGRKGITGIKPVLDLWSLGLRKIQDNFGTIYDELQNLYSTILWIMRPSGLLGLRISKKASSELFLELFSWSVWVHRIQSQNNVSDSRPSSNITDANLMAWPISNVIRLLRHREEEIRAANRTFQTK